MKSYITFLTSVLLFVFTNGYVYSQTKSAQYENYIKKYRTLAMQQQKRYNIPASITLAQGLLESAAGTSRLAREANNHFGIKCKDEWTGARIYQTDDAPDECFRKYNSVEDSYIDHSEFLAYRKYYVSLFDLDIYDYKAWANGLKKCGYATDKNYAKKLIALIEDYELYLYDHTQTNKLEMADESHEIKVIESEKSLNKIPATIKQRRKFYEANNIHYIIAQENDTYESIASDLQMKLKKLLKYNETDSSHKLKKGDIVYLQGKKKYAEKKYKIHIVVKGDSMYGISQLYGMRLKYLYKINKLDDNYIPKIGDTIKVRK